MEKRELIASSGGHVPVTITDIANIVLSSTELTGVIISTITKIVREILVQGIKEIYLTIDGIRTEIEIVKADSKRTRKLTNFAHTVTDYTTVKQYIVNSSGGKYDEGFKQEWLRRIEESFYKEMAQIAADF